MLFRSSATQAAPELRLERTLQWRHVVITASLLPAGLPSKRFCAYLDACSAFCNHSGRARFCDAFAWAVGGLSRGGFHTLWAGRWHLLGLFPPPVRLGCEVGRPTCNQWSNIDLASNFRVRVRRGSDQNVRRPGLLRAAMWPSSEHFGEPPLRCSGGCFECCLQGMEFRDWME